MAELSRCRSSAWPRPAGAWTEPQPESLETHGGGVEPEAFAKLSSRLRYVNSDCRDSATFKHLRQALGEASRPCHYMAIPPSLFGPVAESLATSGCADGARLIIEKPFGHDLASAQALNTTLQRVFRSRRSSVSIASSAGTPIAEPPLLHFARDSTT